MAVEVFAGAAVGAVVQQLLKAVIDAKDKVSFFKPALKRLESTLVSIIPRVNEIIQLNHELEVPEEGMKELITILRSGVELICRCSEISNINILRKVKYSEQLLELDNSLLRYFQAILPLDHSRDGKEMLLMLRELYMGHVGAKDEGESTKSKEDESSQGSGEEESSKHEGDEYSGKKNILERVIKIKDQIISSSTLFNHQWSELETWTFRLNGCIYIFRPEEYTINSDEKIFYKETHYVANCQCKKRHGYVMVSRIEKVRIGKSEFERQMETSGKIKDHPNIVSLCGYCFYQSELFLFYDTFPKGAGKGASLYTRLHGDSWRVANSDSAPIRSAPGEFSWESKLKIAHGVARGISHLHSVKCIHGNLHSYNVIINSDLDGCISDYGLLNFSSATKQSDVYSFGVILLEMLSETNPSDFEDHHRWVEEVVPVQKKKYSRTNTFIGKVDKQGRKMLKIAMLCVQKDLDKRPEMDNVVKKIQKIQTFRL